MIQGIMTLVCLAAFGWAFFSPTWAWLPIGIADAFLLYVLRGAKQVRWKHIPELSATANQMREQYGHFYTMPFAASDYSASASTLQFAGIAVAIVGAFKGFWWGLGIGALNYFVMGGTAAIEGNRNG